MEMQQLGALFLIMLRSIGMFALIPVPWDLLGLGQRLILSLGLGIFFAPIVSVDITLSLTSLILNFVIGFLLALPLALLVEIASMLGELFDAARGQTIAQAYDPGQQNITPITSNLAQHFTWALLVSLGALNALIINMGDSLKSIPLDFQVNLLSDLGVKLSAFLVVVLENSFFCLIPIFAIFLCIEVALGFISKGMNGVGLVSEGFIAKLVLGTFVLVAVNSPDLGSVLIQSVQLSLVSMIAG